MKAKRIASYAIPASVVFGALVWRFGFVSALGLVATLLAIFLVALGVYLATE